MPQETDKTDLENRFTYHPPTEDQEERYKKIRGIGLGFASCVLIMAPQSREKSLALTKIEEAVMWANAAIARHE